MAESYRIGRVEVRIEDRGFETPCHVWQGAKNSKGYGSRFIRGRSVLAHRQAFIDAGLADPWFGEMLHHRCEVPLCVNVDHLEAVKPWEHAERHPRHSDRVWLQDGARGDDRIRTGVTARPSQPSCPPGVARDPLATVPNRAGGGPTPRKG